MAEVVAMALKMKEQLFSLVICSWCRGLGSFACRMLVSW